MYLTKEQYVAFTNVCNLVEKPVILDDRKNFQF